mmetsp:Transcript_73164/g.145506  ORF Transcript_73164/g.145506 Transcript_73164/m.145506 type:complete len:305 (+) Transcript_73164:534-1448(+)
MVRTSSAQPLRVHCMPLSPTTSCRAASSFQALATSRWRVRRPRMRRRWVVSSSCGHWPWRMAGLSSSVRCVLKSSLRFAVSRMVLRCRTGRLCTALVGSTQCMHHGCPTSMQLRAFSRALLPRMCARSMTASTRLGCSMALATADWCRRGAVCLRRRWRVCVRERICRARKCTHPTWTMRSAWARSRWRAARSARRGCRLLWTQRYCRALWASFGRRWRSRVARRRRCGSPLMLAGRRHSLTASDHACCALRRRHSATYTSLSGARSRCGRKGRHQLCCCSTMAGHPWPTLIASAGVRDMRPQQ